MSHQVPTNLDLGLTHGVLLIGVLFAALLVEFSSREIFIQETQSFQGVLTVQVYQYYQDFPDDPRKIKILVATLWILGLIQLALISHSVYFYLVISWGNVQALRQMILPLAIHLFFVAFSILFAQLFFLYRIWVFSQRNVWIVGPVFVCCLGTFGFILAGAAFIITRFQFPGAMIGMLTIGTVTDILIAALLCYYVHKRSEETRYMRVTSTLVTQVIRYTVATSGLTSVIMLSCLFAVRTAQPSQPRLSSLDAPALHSLYEDNSSQALHFSSGRTYANAVLVNLNARSKIRETLDNMEPSFARTLELGGSSSAIRRLPRLSSRSLEHSSRFTTSPSRSITRENKPFMQVPLNAYPPQSFRPPLP
ncbi:hypothetical protein D9756_010690 [Leucocoprinus leucothites]|uniref:DUF6534 domain-containing protein n=1 Tax=Leucocoprinus leucothites TaxID=201217 RepID=A0A8H5CT40_9AGAR|nr:hypothetical protein D9756_010690 [Leucoagaricus leucothites]